MTEQYLRNVATRDVIIGRSFIKHGGIYNFFNTLKIEIDRLFKSTYMEVSWVTCTEKCESLKKFFEEEEKSTAYILRCLERSIINVLEDAKLNIFCLDISAVTGEWENDKHLFVIQNFEQDKGRLIMGFGPSAAGKTYWAKNVIKLLADIDDRFPTEFLSIDGGTYREASLVYQMLVESLIQKNIGGLTNLVVAGLSAGKKSLFDSGHVKTIIYDYLKTQRTPNLYVPETLGGCAFGGISTRGICRNYYQKYIDITKDDDWVGICIWQHKHGGECVFGPHYKCIGCTESGKERERKEGKQYSNAAYHNSLTSGNIHAKNANKWFIVHNTGGKKYIPYGRENPVPCINLIESNIEIPKDIQRRYNCEVHKQIPLKK